jgi:hypothetical protein
VDLLPETAGRVAGFTVGLLALLAAGAPATAQQPSSPPAAQEPCKSAPAEHLGPFALRDCFYRSGFRASRAAKHLIEFETGIATDPSTASAYADVVAAAGDAIVDLAGETDGELLLARIRDVVITQGPQPSVRVSDGRLIVTIAPALGAAGLVSTTDIEQAIRAPPAVRPA